MRLDAIAMNHALDEMEAVTGLHGFSKRIQVPDIPKCPPILNHIKIDNSVVGAINTGTTTSIDVSITHLKAGGNDTAGVALADLTEAIARASGLSDVAKNDLLEQVAFLSAQAAQAVGDRRPGMIRAVFQAVTGGAN